MSNLRKIIENEKVELQIAPLIDVVFLLLIYFMVTSTLKTPEADLGITLPGTLVQSKSILMPDEQIIEVKQDGRVILNDRVYGADDDRDLGSLVATLIRYRQAASGLRSKALVTIQSDDDGVHQRVVDVMNACAGAQIKHVTFGMGSEE